MQKSQIHSTAGKEKAPLPPSVSFVAADGRQATTAEPSKRDIFYDDAPHALIFRLYLLSV